MANIVALVQNTLFFFSPAIFPLCVCGWPLLVSLILCLGIFSPRTVSLLRLLVLVLVLLVVVLLLVTIIVS